MSETGEQGPIKETSLPQAEAQISQQEPAPTHTASVENVEVPGGDHGQSVEALGLAPIPQATKLRRECLSGDLERHLMWLRLLQKVCCQ